MVSRLALVAAFAGLLAACGGEPREETPPGAGDGAAQVPPEPAAADDPSGAGWDLVSSGEGVALVFPAEGEVRMRLFCPADEDRILVNVPAFRPVGSEERLSFGSGGAVEALVADTRGDALRGGVSGTGAVPGNLGALLGGPVSVNYGAQNSGPHPPPPAGLVRGFVRACNEGGPGSSPRPSPTPAPSPTNVSACRMQGDERLTNPPLRAIGTEPFWGARIEGRCVTYSHIDDQQGTRVWTRYTPGPDGTGTWSGALGDRLFELTIRARPRCSDGMSDKRYALEAELKVHGEVRRGCAEPL